MLQALTDRLLILLQQVLPERALGRAVYRLARSRQRWFKNLLINGFVRLYAVDLDELDRRAADEYDSLNAFFTRPLRAGARPLPAEHDTVVSPADGRIEALGYADGDALLQAKRYRYRIADLLAISDGAAGRYHGGATATVYLAPHNYHRVHMPLAGRVREMVYIPGRRWAVNARTTRSVAGLFTANERVVLHCEHAHGPFAVVFVGALNVASVTVAWTGEIAAPPGHGLRRWSYPESDPSMAFAAGDLLGQFNLGSTVVLVAARGLVRWDDDISAGTGIRMGMRLGRATD